MKAWHFGNTSVRSALRLRDGLIAIKKYGLEGKIRKGEGDINFRKILGDEEIVNLGTDATASVGRKWRSALEKMGFITPELKKNQTQIREELGPSDHISINGQRLINADTINGWQECFLRALVAHYIKEDSGILSSPFLFTLRIMSALLEKEGSSKLSITEMALIIQTASPSTNVSEIVDQILSFRKDRNASANKRIFDREKTSEIARNYGLVESTLRDYADTNFRYIKATGIISASGKGIAFVPEKIGLIRQIIEKEKAPQNEFEKFKLQCDGAKLPTDQEESALIVLDGLVALLQEKGEKIDLSQYSLKTPADIAVARHNIEDRLFELKEIDFAKRQREAIEEISGYLQLLNKRKMSMTLEDGTEIKIPQGEAPAYFEWAIWRAFLAINSLTIMPWEARRFQIDQDFLPVSPASGGGADVIIELEKMIIVVEVTLTQSSRQEAAEGEPVRRHVAQLLEQGKDNGKDVFGLFLAVNIDTNTANTFRLGDWYKKDDTKLNLHIIPLPLCDFISLLKAAPQEPEKILPHLKTFFMQCRMDSNVEAPLWKEKISLHVQNLLETI